MTRCNIYDYAFFCSADNIFKYLCQFPVVWPNLEPRVNASGKPSYIVTRCKQPCALFLFFQIRKQLQLLRLCHVGKTLPDELGFKRRQRRDLA